MKNIKLKMKLIVGALGLVIMVMIASQGVIMMLLNQENRKIADDRIEKGLNIVREELLDTQQKLLSDTRQMANANKMSSLVKYLFTIKKDTNYNQYAQAYISITHAINQVGHTGNLWHMAVYDADGDLRCFAVRQDQQSCLLGFIHSTPTTSYYAAEYREGVEVALSDWTKQDRIEAVGTLLALRRDWIGREAARFLTVGGALCLTVDSPIMADVFNPSILKVEKKQIGFATATLKLEPAFIEKMTRLTGLSINLFGDGNWLMGDRQDYKQLNPEQLGKQTGSDSLEIQKVVLGETILQKATYFEGLLPLYSDAVLVGTVSALQSLDLVREGTSKITRLLWLIFLICLVVIIPITIFFSNSLIKPISRVVKRLDDLAGGEGDLTARLEARNNDEIGQLAGAFNTFMEKMQAMMKDIAGNANALDHSSLNLSQLSEEMSGGAGQMSQTSSTVVGAVESMSANIAGMAQAMERTSSEMGMVSAAAEEMTTTINEIANSSEKARTVTNNAVSQARRASERLGMLGEAAQKISQVTETINEISEQTNLLALNATIEAARAGDAGKGFAVVANEIKELARQTARATQEIKEKIGGIQTSVAGSVEEIDQILKVINEIDGVVSTIASAIEEQSSTTQEISKNVTDASQGIEEVNRNVAQTHSATAQITSEMGHMDNEAGEISQKSAQVNRSSHELTELANRLKEMVGRFKV